MGYASAIEWTTHTFNPWWGCTKVSDGCKFCYAEALSNRYGQDVWGVNAPRRVMSDGYWREPLRWDLEAAQIGVRFRVFCASMADVFEERAPEGQRERLWQLIRQTPHLGWQLLTKRPQLMSQYLPDDWDEGYPNVWLGTSIEDERVLNRVGQLTQTPAVVHFLSLEPLIGPLPVLPLEDVEWVIVGGESGPKSRPIQEDWVLDIKAQCEGAEVAFFFKQWGGRNKKANGRLLQGHTFDQLPLSPIELQPAAATAGALCVLK